MRSACIVGTVLLLGIFVIPAADGQIVSDPDVPERIEYGSVPDSLFRLESDHEASYEYLNRQIEIEIRRTDGRAVVRTVYHNRIRILREDPARLAEAALVSIPLHTGGGVERISEIRGATHREDREPVELEPDGIRRNRINERYTVVEFLMPDVRPGSILEYRYVVERHHLEELPELVPGESVPVRSLRMTLHSGDLARYRAVGSDLAVEVGYHREMIEREGSDEPAFFMQRRPEPVPVEHWFARNLPALEEEPYAPALEDRHGRVRFQLVEFGEPRQPLLNSWDFVAAQIRRSGLNPFPDDEEMAALMERAGELTEGVESREERMNRIFEYVNRSAEFSGEMTPFGGGDPTRVLDGEPADQASINRVLMTMLRGAGVEAWPVYVTGREAGRVMPDFPSLFQFNQMLVAARPAEELVWMDGSYALSHPGLIRVDSWSEQGWLLSESDHRWVRLNPSLSHYRLQVSIDAEFDRSGNLDGRLSATLSGYPARRIREAVDEGETDRVAIRSLFFDSYPQADVDVEILEEGDERHTLRTHVDFAIPGYALTFQEGLQFHPVLVGYLDEQPFPDPDRRWPVRLDAPEEVTMEYTLRFPDGFDLPDERGDRVTGLSGARFRESYESHGQRLGYRFGVTIRRLRFDPEEYGKLRSLYDRWLELSRDEWFIEEEP